MKFILGKKLGMNQVFDKNGNIVPVTVIEAGPCFVTQIKTKEPRKAPSEQRGKKDGYEAIQIGFERLKDKKIKKPQKDRPYRFIREFLAEGKDYKIGDEITVEIFNEGDKIKASGISKGRGFQGVVKRHGFSGGPASHGHRHVLRRPGSIGSSFPERVIKGKKMPGRTGFKRTTIKNLKVVIIDAKNNLLAVTGAIPGPIGSLVEIKTC